jgi:hypothetical protein
MLSSVRLNRRGATLPLTVIVLALMAVAVGITYARVSTERLISGDSKAQFGAFAVAQSGLNRYLSNLNGKPVNPGPWTATYNDLPGGTARVDMVMLRESTSTLLPAVYAITSRGQYTAARKYNSLTPPAERTVATYALWTPAPFDLNGAMTSLTAVTITGGSASLSGIDRCGGAMPMIPGVAVPDDAFAGAAGVVHGNPEGDEQDLGTPGPGGGADQAVNIDWAGIKNGGLMPPAYTWPAWPGVGSPGMLDWPITRVNNDGGADFIMPAGNGKGILIVTGNLRINGMMPVGTWEGVILVGGSVRINGNHNIYGAIVSGLNVKLGQVVGTSDLGNGVKTIQYDSCALNRALGKIGSIQRVRNAWTDTWSSY